METQRMMLYVALLLVSFMLWNAWQKEHLRAPTTPVTTTTKVTADQPKDAVQKATPSAPQSALAIAASAKKAPSQRLITVKTGTLNVKIDTLGGNIIGVSLPKYPKELKTPNIPYTLMNDSTENRYTAESALIGENGPDSASSLAQYSTTAKNYTLSEDQKTLTVDLAWENQKGLKIVKSFAFNKNSYLVNVSYHIANNMSEPWKGALSTQLSRRQAGKKGSSFFNVHSYAGAAFSTPEQKYEELGFKKMKKEDLNKTAKGGWAAMVQRYFLSAWIPNSAQQNTYYSKASADDTYVIGITGPVINVKPGTSDVVSAKLYAGPEVPNVLRPIAPGLELTVSYGWLWMLAVMLFWCLRQINNIVGNWGWSIIIITLLIKLVFYHLSTKSYESMAKMRSLQPKLEALRERFKGDKQKLSQATMEFYKKEKVNPISGCLPVIIQIPVFFALYMVLIESVALRQAPWILWIQDLAKPDPLYILPILMGITMFFQQKLNPAPPDPMQAKLMMALPVVFTVMFVNFPAGLVLYWTANNALSILQQWHVTRKIEAQIAKKKASR